MSDRKWSQWTWLMRKELGDGLWTTFNWEGDQKRKGVGWGSGDSVSGGCLTEVRCVFLFLLLSQESLLFDMYFGLCPLTFWLVTYHILQQSHRCKRFGLAVCGPVCSHMAWTHTQHTEGLSAMIIFRAIMIIRASIRSSES